MDQLARRHLVNRLAAAQRRHDRAVDDLAQFARNVQYGTESWHNLATVVGLGAHAAGEIEAYTAALAADDASNADPKG